MSEASQKIRDFIQNPVDETKRVHRLYGLDQQEFSKILIITCTALLVVSVHASTTLGSVQEDLENTNDQVQQASAVINSDSFQQAMDALQRIQSASITRQIRTARNSFESAQQSFEQLSVAEQKVSESRSMYQWMSLISILGIVSGVALRFM